MIRLPTTSSRLFLSPSTSTSTSCLRTRGTQCLRLHTPTRPRPISPTASSPRLHAQTRHQHAVSNPTLANIEKRWSDMPPQEQAELWMALRDRMTVDWHHMTMQEKRASYWIAFGPHGPRAQDPPGANWYIFRQVCLWVGASVVVFAVIRYFAREPPKTMSREWQEATNAMVQKERIEPITGPGAEDYKGKGMIQSAPRGFKFEDEEEDEEEE